MKCKNCGAGMLDSDQFCAQCGWKVEKERRCSDCGTVLREGVKFCHACGRMVGASEDASDKRRISLDLVKEQATLDIPIADIEKNILQETAQELGAVSAKKAAQKKMEMAEAESERKAVKAAVQSPEQRRKKKVYKEEWEEEDWDAEEADVNEDDEDYEENSHNIMTIVSVVMALLIFVIAAFVVFTMIRKQPIKDYGANAESVQEETENGASDDEQAGSETGMQVIGTLTIVSNVNVRDNPSTEGTNIIKVAKAGDMYQYCGKSQDDNWYIILLEDGSTGYVFKDYVSAE